MSDDEHPDPTEPAGVRLAREIRRRRTAAGLSQPQLAQKIGYTRQYVSLAERADHNLPSMEIVKALDHALHAEDALTALREQGKREQERQRQQSTRKTPGNLEAHAPTRPSLGRFTETHLDDALRHLGEQWHLLVKTDNLFGPRFAIKSVCEHIDLINGIAGTVRGAARRDVVGLAARYAESAAWLHEDAGEAASALHWTDRAMEWAYESGDRAMLAWTLFRRSQQATTGGDAARTIGMAEAAGRDTAALSNPMRAAIIQQEAQGYALDGDERTTHRKLDQAHAWAAHDDWGDARDGHGSFCTGNYLELQRAHCWSILGRHDKAVVLYEDVLPSLPAAYRRDRGTALSRFAAAAVAVAEPERAAQLASEALDIARDSGSLRTEHALRDVATALSPHGHLPTVAAFRAKALSGGAR
ncbi:helix-turn-helix transcriptional regulator [Saccharothrix longispora]|uniref:helix-turn-helix transcriptional regulator n=1 Tax=Saccharothrix longispora TaxID=33920 RepID=UPI0028FD2E2D|nr:helix-turn-helix transcriptional regulator [Saccharothrix longispora]MDU0294297.1 helix-turn-helix transcriptional regulator [Saccharothrix longispora]